MNSNHSPGIDRDLSSTNKIRSKLPNTGADRLAQVDELFALIPGEEDAMLGNPLPEHLVLGLEKLDVPTKLVRGAPSQEGQQWLEQPSPGSRVLAENAFKEGDSPFAPRHMSPRGCQVSSTAVGRQPESEPDNRCQFLWQDRRHQADFLFA